MSSVEHKPRKTKPRKGVQRFFVGQFLEPLNATVVGVRIARESAPSSDVVHVQYSCCEEPYQARGSELHRKLQDAKRGALAYPTRCPACARLGDRKSLDKPGLPFAGGPRWAVPKI